MFEKAKTVALQACGGIMDCVATRINEQDPEAAKNAMMYLFYQSGLSKPGAMNGMRNRLIAYKNTPKGEETLN